MALVTVWSGPAYVLKLLIPMTSYNIDCHTYIYIYISCIPFVCSNVVFMNSLVKINANLWEMLMILSPVLPLLFDIVNQLLIYC